MTSSPFRPTLCAICGSAGNSSEIYPARLPSDAFTAATFSARRIPDGIHYRLVRCRSCGLVRSDPTVDPEQIESLYRESAFEYGNEVEHLVETYGKYLRHLDRFGACRGSLLEIGCGNGFFLEEALRQGYVDVRGVEPSSAAVAQTTPDLRGLIHAGKIEPGLYEAESFDVICLFQVLDHMAAPAAVLDQCFTILKPGGLVLCLNHNVDAVSARILGEKSPIVDVEHTYLYSPRTIRILFERHGFRVERIAAAWNRYSAAYLLRLLPLPPFLKDWVLARLGRRHPSRVSLRLPLGNVLVVARKAAIPRRASN